MMVGEKMLEIDSNLRMKISLKLSQIHFSSIESVVARTPIWKSINSYNLSFLLSL